MQERDATAEIYLREWLVRNASYQNQNITNQESEDTAGMFMEQCEVHSPREIVYQPTGEPKVTRREFRVTIGKPKFRGSTSYTLQSHSLLFNTKHPTDVRILLDTDKQGHIDKILKNQKIAFDDSIHSHKLIWQTYDDLNAYLPCHPHIATDGSPCLGGWSGAWSATVVTSNIPALVNVAKSFLNTWTSDDAYWNINRKYSDWRYMSANVKSSMPFNKWLPQEKVWEDIASKTYSFSNVDKRVPRIGDWLSFLRSNENDISDFASTHGDNWAIELYDLFMGWSINTSTAGDTEDELFEKLHRVGSMFQNVFTRTIDKITIALDAPSHISSALARDAMQNTPNRLQKNPWNNPNAPYVASFAPMVRAIDDSQSHILNSAPNKNARVSDLLLYHNVLLGDKKARFIRHCSVTEALNSIEAHWPTSYRLVNVLATLKEFTKVTGIDTGIPEIGVDSQVDAYVSFVKRLASSSHFKTATSIDDFYEKLSDHFAHISINTYTGIIQNYSTTRLINARDKYKPIFRDRNIGDSTEQNQLSAF